jgi:predicted  nucleic acid-binding Zn-ribbon protein
MRGTLDTLLILQQLDDEIDDLRDDEEAIPQEKKDLAAEVEQAENKVKAHRQEALDLAKERKTKEIELEEAGQKKAKFQGQLFQVKSNREYDALQHEINGLDSVVSSLEDGVLEIMERGEIVTRSIAEEEQAMKATQERVAKEQTMLDEKAESLRQAVAVKSAERERLIAGLDAALLTRYEKIREVKDGLAVVTVQNGACGGCYRRIPPQEMQILRRSDRIKTCEGCGRILIYREETGQAQPGQDARRDTGEPPSQQDVQ